MAKYTLNVDPDVEYELSDVEVTDLRAMGFSVSRRRDNTDGGQTTRRPAEVRPRRASGDSSTNNTEES